MEERNEDVLAEARRYLSDLVAFEGTQFTAPEAVVEHKAEEPAVDTLEVFRQQICECTRCRLGETRQNFVFAAATLRPASCSSARPQGRKKIEWASPLWEGRSTADQDHRGYGSIARRGLYLQHTQVPSAE